MEDYLNTKIQNTSKTYGELIKALLEQGHISAVTTAGMSHWSFSEDNGEIVVYFSGTYGTEIDSYTREQYACHLAHCVDFGAWQGQDWAVGQGFWNWE